MNAIKTTHNLDFEVSENWFGPSLFRIGSCEGQWGSTSDSYYILSVINSDPGNGHLDDVFEWFEYACKRDNCNLLVLECINEGFAQHLIYKRGLIPLTELNYIKIFNKKLYKKLIKKGNEILNKDLTSI